MPYNILNKKQWLEGLDELSDWYVELIRVESDHKKDYYLVNPSNDHENLILTDRYNYKKCVYTGQEIIDAIRKKLANDNDYVYTFKTIDNKSVISKSYRVILDQEIKKQLDKTISELEDINQSKEKMFLTIDDLKVKYVSSLRDIDKLNDVIKYLRSKNYELYLEVIESVGGIYQYAKKNKLILMLSKILKDEGVYDENKGTRYSYEDLKVEDRIKITKIFYEKVFERDLNKGD